MCKLNECMTSKQNIMVLLSNKTLFSKESHTVWRKRLTSEPTFLASVWVVSVLNTWEKSRKPQEANSKRIQAQHEFTFNAFLLSTLCWRLLKTSLQTALTNFTRCEPDACLGFALHVFRSKQMPAFSLAKRKCDPKERLNYIHLCQEGERQRHKEGKK